MGLENPIIVALDCARLDDALAIVRRLKPDFDYFKIGSTLFVSEGPKAVKLLIAEGARVFLDLKFHDIPKQVAGAVKAASMLGVSMITVHCLGGSDMMKAAAEALVTSEGSRGRPVLLGVTVLTSHDESLEELGIVDVSADEVIRLAGMALDSGLDGVVASAREARLLREKFGNDFLIVTPGIRGEGQSVYDQLRTATPAEAVSSGANYLVVGRPITMAPDPREEARRMRRQAAGV